MAPGFADDTVMVLATGVCECPKGHWVAAVDAAADTASAVTAVALADLPCRTDGLRCRDRRARTDGRAGVTGGCDGLRCRAWVLDTLEYSG